MKMIWGEKETHAHTHTQTHTNTSIYLSIYLSTNLYIVLDKNKHWKNWTIFIIATNFTETSMA